MSRKYTSLPYTEYDVNEGSFDSNRKPIDRIVLHTTIGTIESTRATFAGTKGTSAHYAVGWDGKLYAFLEEYNVAYATGNYPMNQRSISIEHVDNGNYTSIRPDVLYETSAKLVADICKEYGIPCDRTHILKHNEIVATGCPHNLEVDRIISRANQILGGVPQVNEDKVNADRWKNLMYDNPYGWSEPDHVRKTIKDLQTNESRLNGVVTDKDKEIAVLKNEITQTQDKADIDCKKQLADVKDKCQVDLVNALEDKNKLIKELQKQVKDGVVIQKVEPKKPTTFKERLQAVLELILG